MYIFLKRIQKTLKKKKNSKSKHSSSQLHPALTREAAKAAGQDG